MLSLLRDIVRYFTGHRYVPMVNYMPDLDELPRPIVEKFELQHPDADSAQFLQEAGRGKLWKFIVARCLYPFFSFTTVNGWLNTAHMYVVSTDQLKVLLRPEDVRVHKSGHPSAAVVSDPTSWEEEAALVEALPLPTFGSVLDIGSGDGTVTARLLPFLAEGCGPAAISCTEVSASMRYRLQQRGFTVLDCHDPYHDPSGERRYFDLITCFNVLDRIDTPQTMLREIRDSLRPGGMAVLAVVLPWCPFVENGSRQKRPSELLPMKGGECCKGASYEQSVAKLVEKVLLPTGFDLVRWTRVPYLCEGDLEVQFAVLNDALFILKKKESPAF